MQESTPQPAAPRTPLQSALSKARLRIIPLLSVCYLVAYMDRVNISFAAESMNRQLHFTPSIYGLGAGIFFVSYALCEIPSNRMLLRFGARRWLARIMLTWGVVAAAMVFLRTPASFYSLRFALGMAEAGYFPGALYFLSQWFPAGERARSISLFYIAFPLSNVVMGGLAGVLLHQDGRLGLAGWQWLFLLEALPAIVLSGVIFFCLPDDPAQARWLDQAEREALADKLHAERPRSPHPDTADLGPVLRNPRVWGVGAVFLMTLGSNYAVTFSLPLVLGAATGRNVSEVGWMIAASGLVGAAAMLVAARHSDLTRERARHIAVPAVVMGLALAAAAAQHLSGWGTVAALFVAGTSYYSLQGPLLSVGASVLSGRPAAVAIAVINMCGICGGFIGPYWMGWMREATGGYAWGVGLLAVPLLGTAALILRLEPRHKRNG